MIFRETRLGGAFIIQPEMFQDERGYFARLWCQREFEARSLCGRFVQSNVSFNRQKGTLRGLHYQAEPHAEAKLVRCTKGAIYDVIVDLREESPTYKKWIGVELVDHKQNALYVPKGFAHGYQTLTDNAEVVYQVTEFYCPSAERGVRWDDPTFKVNWPPAEKRVISRKDQQWAVPWSEESVPVSMGAKKSQ